MKPYESDAIFTETEVKSVWYNAYNELWRFLYTIRRNALRKLNARIYAIKRQANQPELVVVEYKTARR